MKYKVGDVVTINERGAASGLIFGDKYIIMDDKGDLIYKCLCFEDRFNNIKEYLLLFAEEFDMLKPQSSWPDYL